MRVIWIAAFGAAGTASRYLVEGWVSRKGRGFPWGTFVVNMTGSFLLGLAFTLLTERFTASSITRSAITIGFLGAYTTFSTLTFETMRLIERGAMSAALLNAAGSLVVGLMAVWAGTVVGKAI